MRKHRSLLSRPAADTAASPAWVVTYADLVTLLLCIFVGLFSMSAIRPERFQTALGSLQGTFGSKDPPSASEPGDDSLYGKIHAVLAEESKMAFSADPGGPWVTVSRTARGVQVVLAGPKVFHRGETAFSEKTNTLLHRIAAVVRDSSYSITISGHSAGEGKADDGDPRDLSYERAAGVARRLAEAGVARHRLQVSALGEDHPALDHAYTEKRRAMNRRVEIEIVEGGEPGGAAEMASNK